MILDFVFPRKCLGCGEKGVYFCSSCIKNIKVLEPQVFLGKRPFQALFSVFAYEGIIRQAILKLKYKLITDLTDELIGLVITSFHQDLFDFSNCLTLVPVPLHWYRRNWRGFNQAEVLGQKLAQQFKIGFNQDLLYRTQQTQPQVKLKGKTRKANVRNVFEINNPLSADTEILLFDDVWTTGATMKECALVLQKAGAKKVFGLTLAR